MSAIKQRWHELAGSSLVRALTIRFLTIVLLETVCLGYLCYETVQAERQAAREIRLLRTVAEFANLSDLLRKHRHMFDRQRQQPTAYQSVMLHAQSCYVIRRQMEKLHASWQQANLNPRQFQRLEENNRQLLEQTSIYFSPASSPQQRTAARRAYLADSAVLYDLASRYINVLSSDVTSDATINSDPWPFIVAMLLSNLLVAALMAGLLDRSLVSPIMRLADNCRLLAAGRTMPPPQSKNADLGALEKAFYDMSVIIAENEKGRRSYLELLQQSQLASLTAAGDAIAGLSRWSIAQALVVQMGGSIERMQNLLRSLSESLSRSPDEDRLTVNRSCIDSGTMFSNASAAIDALARKAQVTVTVEDPHCSAEVDTQLIERVIVNLLANALKFSAPGSCVVLSGTCAEAVLRVSVTDQGPGIAEGDQLKLFQKFSQLAPGGAGSSGLGLSICKQLVEAHGGTIGCRSQVGQGSTFWFELPRSAPPPSAEPAIAQAKDIRPPVPTRLGIKAILIGILGVLLIGQTCLALHLHQKFQESTASAAKYARQKQTVVETQLLMALFLNWREQVFKALSNNDLAHALSVYPLLKQQSNIAHHLVETTGAGAMHEMWIVVADQIDALRKLTREGLRNASLGNRDAMNNAYRQGDESGAAVENQLFAAMRMENAGLNLSYDLGEKLRSDILLTVVLAAAGDLVMLLLLLVFGLSLLNGINTLNRKVAQLSGSPLPEREAAGPAELAYLDQCLTVASRKIHAAHERRQHLMAAINHDLRSPLTSVLGGFEMLQDGVFGELSDEQLTELKCVEHNLLKVLHQVNDLLTIEKLESGLMEAHLATVDVRGLVETTTEKARRRWKEAGVTLTVATGGDADELTVLADDELLEWVCGAALDNAVAACGPGGRVLVEAAAQPDGVALTIKDSGHGIAPEISRQIFERFRFVGGKPLTGLGLPLAYRLCKLQNGTLSVEESSAQGTIVKAFFPWSC